MSVAGRPPKRFHSMRGVFGSYYQDSESLVKPRESTRRTTTSSRASAIPRHTQPSYYDHPLAFFAADLPPPSFSKLDQADPILRVHLQTIETSITTIQEIRKDLEESAPYL
ncbi:hypothetical protein ACHHYP_16369 [Achlya hypogyna]|uniref:Uncharacterized protein n=1 Tax=Achlya hypogyna TaxID=1202772 RepID=A0A1V9Y8V5_ACHHY|nr:hypothetical protein ACHHYP_16369 [Achlya hypogyna]